MDSKRVTEPPTHRLMGSLMDLKEYDRHKPTWESLRAGLQAGRRCFLSACSTSNEKHALCQIVGWCTNPADQLPLFNSASHDVRRRFVVTVRRNFNLPAGFSTDRFHGRLAVGFRKASVALFASKARGGLAMSIRSILTVAVLWVMSLFIVASIVKAQSYQIRPLPEPKIVSGADFGMRIEGDQNGTAVGTLVVRVNGRWIDAREGHVQGVPRITSR
jgi:hypothetical protein